MLAYGILELFPEQFEALSIIDFDRILKARMAIKKTEDFKRVYLACMMVNVHLPKRNQLKIKDIMDVFYPKTKAERMLEDMKFMQEFEEQKKSMRGGEEDE